MLPDEAEEEEEEEEEEAEETDCFPLVRLCFTGLFPLRPRLCAGAESASRDFLDFGLPWRLPDEDALFPSSGADGNPSALDGGADTTLSAPSAPSKLDVFRVGISETDAAESAIVRDYDLVR